MATSGYTTVNITPFDYLKMSWELKAQNKANNTSTISWKLELVSLQHGKIISSANKYCAITIDGKTSTYDVNIAIENNTTKTLCSGAAVIPHNADGTKTFYYSCGLSVNITFNGEYIGKKGGTSKGTLDTISRASTILVPSGAFIGDIIDITLTKYNNRYTHTVIAHFVTSEVTIYEKETISGNVISWRIPTSFYNDIPDRTSANLNIYCITYDGDTQIGSHIATLNCGVNITENRPAFNPSVIDMLYTNLTGDGLAQTVINGYNTLEIGFGAVAQNGASIKEYKVQVGDITEISTSDYFIINNVTSNKFVFTVTDSRGRTSTSKSVSITVQDYSIPKITSFNVIRCTSNGTANNEGTYIKAYAQYTYTSLSGKNSANASVAYKLAPNGTNSSSTTVSSGNSVIIGGGSISTSSSYAVTLTLKDNFTTITKVLSITPSHVTMDFRAGGKGVAIGKLSTSDDFEVQSATKFYNGVKTYSNSYNMDSAFEIIESPTNAGVGQARIRIGGSGSGASYGLLIQGPGDATYIQIKPNTILAGSNNAFDLGNTTYRWRTLYSINAINTSDELYKENIEYLSINSDVKNISDSISQEDIYNFYKDSFKLSKYNYKEQNHKEYGFIAQDLAEDNVGKTIVIDDENGYMYSVGSYISTVAGALQYEINLRDKQIKELISKIEALEKAVLNKN